MGPRPGADVSRARQVHDDRQADSRDRGPDQAPPAREGDPEGQGGAPQDEEAGVLGLNQPASRAPSSNNNYYSSRSTTPTIIFDTIDLLQLPVPLSSTVHNSTPVYFSSK